MTVDQQDLLARAQQVFMPNVRPRHVFVQGRGAWLYDAAGRPFLDFLAGIGVNLFGHGHPALLEAMRRQLGQVVHHSNLYLSPPALELATELAGRIPDGRVFFANSGAEAVEAGIKLARAYFRRKRGEDRFEIVAMRSAFHGRTLGALACTGNVRYQQGFEPLVGGVVHVPFGDAAAAERAVNPRTAAILVEPIQGEGGVVVPPADYLGKLREIADRSGCLLFLDEVQTGMGRTGRLFAHQWDGVCPDMVCLAKGLGGGLPLGALLARAAVAEGFVPGSHGSTMGGNPVACAAGLAGLRLLDGGLLEASAQTASRLRAGLEELSQRLPGIVELRGRGLMLGLVLDRPAGEVMERCLERGLLVNTAGAKVLRLLPPLVLSAGEADQGLALLESALAPA